MTAEARSVVVRLTAETAQYIREMQRSGAVGAEAMTAVESSATRASRAQDQLGRNAGRVGLLAAAGLAAVIGVTARFDRQMSAVQAATHETEQNMGLLRQAALDAGQATIFSATEAAQGVEELAKAGVSTADVLGGGLRGSLDLAAAGGLEVAESAEIAASALNQFKLHGSDVGHVADLLAAGAGKAQGSVHDLGAALNQAGLVASQTGLSIDETTTALAAFASNGLIGSDAGTSFKTMLLALNPQSVQARNLMDQLGFSAYDASGQFVGLEELARRLQTSLQGMSEQQRNAALQTLFGRDAIRAANVLYTEGADGIAEWTAKVNDQGYAAQTAAARLNNLSGDIEQFTGSLETALINAGESSTGGLRSLVQGATDLVNAFNKAPAPIQSTATSLLAITAATAGGIWVGSRIIRTINDTREALDGLGKSSGIASKGLKALAYAGAGLAALTIGAAAIRTIQQATDESLPSVETLTARLIALNDAKVSDLGAEFDSLGDSLDRIKASEDVFNGIGQVNTTGLSDALQKPFEGLFGEAGSLRQAKAEVEDLDNALANLATTGGADVAQQAFSKLAEAQGLTVEQQSQLRDLLPAYTGALDGAANSAELAGDATDDYAKSTYKAANGTEITASALKKIRSAYQDARKDATETAASFLDISKNADKGKVSLREWLAQLEKQADALENFTANAIKAGKRGLSEGLIAELEKLGPVGALRMKQLANATDEEIDRANRAWKRGQQAVDDYVDATVKVPKELSTHLTVENAQALQHVRDVSVALRGLNDKTITLTTIERTIHQESRIHPRATGGPVRAGQPYIVGERRPELFVPRTDGTILPSVPSSIAAGGAPSGGGPASGSPFDAALQNLVDIVDGHSKKIDKALNDFEPKLSQGVDGVRAEVQELRHAIREAGGHWTSAMQEQADALIEAARAHDIGKALKQFDVDVAQGAEGVRSEIRDLRGAIRDAGGEWTKGLQHQSKKLVETASAYDLAAQSLSDSQSVLNDLLSKQSAYADQVGHVFNDSPFGNGLAGFDKTVGANTNKTNTFLDVLQQLAGQGLDGPLFEKLAAEGDLKTAIQLLATGSAGIDQREQAFAGMLQAQQQLGGYAGGQVFGADVAAAQQVVASNTQALTDLSVRLERQEAKFDRMVKVVEDLPRHVREANHDGSYWGTREGITEVATSAGRRMAMNGGPRP